ncbi:MAG: ParA family protein [Saprospiraceae bacterium]
MSRAKIISYLNLKGGVGKSTLTALTASFLHEKKKNVCVVDCDEDQKTIDLWKKEDIKNGIATYDVYPVLSRDVPDTISEILDEYDFIFVDFPGNMSQKGVKSIWPFLDVVIVPFYPNAEEVDPTVKFYNEFETYNDIRIKGGQNATVMKFFYYRTGRTKKGKAAMKDLEDNGIDKLLLKNVIKHYDTMRDRSSTMDRMQKNSYGYHIDKLCNEVFEIINETEVKEY